MFKSQHTSASFKSFFVLVLLSSLLSGCLTTKQYSPVGINENSPTVEVYWAWPSREQAYYVVQDPCGEKTEEFLAYSKHKIWSDSGKFAAVVQVEADKPITIKAVHNTVRMGSSGIVERDNYKVTFFRFTPENHRTYQFISVGTDYFVHSSPYKSEPEDFVLLGKSACEQEINNGL